MSACKPELPQYITSLVCGFLSNLAFNMTIALVLKMTFDALAGINQTMLVKTVSLGFLMVAVTSLMVATFNYMFDVSVAKLTGRIRSTLFSKLLSLPVFYMDHVHSGEIVSRLTHDLARAEEIYAYYPGAVMSSLITGCVALWLLVANEWRLGLWAVGVGLVGAAINVISAPKMKQLGVHFQTRLAALTKLQADAVNMFVTVKAYLLENHLRDLLGSTTLRVYEEAVHRTKVYSNLHALNVAIASCSAAGTIALGSYLSRNGQVTVGTIVLAVQLENYIRNMFFTLSEAITGVQSSVAAAERVCQLLDIENEPLVYQTADAVDYDGYAITMDGVNFSYGEGPDVLKDINLRVSPGEHVALVGPSGAGKSTIFKLLLGLYPPKTGSITLAGQSMNRLTLQGMRQLTAYVPQDSFMFSGTVLDNIHLGRKEFVQERVFSAATGANAHDFITELDHGYETVIGEQGVRLSGGQRQRIAVARALYKNSPILLLDEATSHLDSDSEKLLTTALANLTQGRTVLTIAHRLSTVESADRIVMIVDGRIVEEGTHSELLAKKGRYSEFYTRRLCQAARATS